MQKLAAIDLTRRESQIMEILHRRQRATVEEIRAELPEAPSPSSVRKLLEIMIERGLLGREYEGPRYVYFPVAKPEEASRSALKKLVFVKVTWLPPGGGPGGLRVMRPQNGLLAGFGES